MKPTYVQLVNPATGQIDCLVFCSGPGKFTESATLVHVPDDVLDGIDTTLAVKDKYRFLNGQFIPLAPKPSQFHTYNYEAGVWQDVRTDAQWNRDRRLGYEVTDKPTYPTIGDQLDMLFKAMDSGEIPKAAKFYASIKVVKDANKRS